MEDLRGRYRLPRRDFGLPASPVPQPRSNPRPPQPAAPKPITHSRQPEPLIHESLRAAYVPPPQAKSRVKAAHQPSAPKHRAAIPQSQPVARPHQVPRKKRRLLKKVLLLCLFLGVLGGSAVWAYPKYAHPNPFPADIKTTDAVDLFYPSKLPAGYSVDKSTMQLGNNKLTYNAVNDGKKLVFTDQKTSSAPSLQSFTSQYLKNSQTFDTYYGAAVVGKNQDRYLGVLVADNSWLIVSTNSTQVTPDQIKFALQNLKKY